VLTHLEPGRVEPARVVVLGASGFLGGAIAARFAARGTPVEALSSRDIDLTTAAAAAALETRLWPDDVLVFVSALTPDRGKDIGTMMRNLAMGEQVCAALSPSRCAHVVYISSDAVYADDVDDVTERSCASPSTYHRLMHLVRERMLASTLGSRIPFTVLRPSLVYGTGDTHNGYGPNRFLRSARAERRIALFGAGEEQRDHVFVGDVARLVKLVITHRSTGVLNVATGASRSFAEVAEVVASLVPDVTIESKPRSGPVTHRRFDMTVLSAVFPWVRMTPLEEGLARA
jgi:nucleoside-diphosphate-sugar epimerase